MWNRLFKNNPNGQTVSLLSKPDLDNTETCNLLKFRTFQSLQSRVIQPKDESNHRTSKFTSRIHRAFPRHFASISSTWYALGTSWWLAMRIYFLYSHSAGHRKTDISSRRHQPCSRKKPGDSSGPAATLEKWLMPSTQEGSGRREEQQTTDSAPRKFANVFEVNLWLIHIQMNVQRQIPRLNIKWLLDSPGFCSFLACGQGKGCGAASTLTLRPPRSHSFDGWSSLPCEPKQPNKTLLPMQRYHWKHVCYREELMSLLTTTGRSYLRVGAGRLMIHRI